MKLAEDKKLNPIKLVSWDVDGTLYSIGHMKWKLVGRLLREVAKGKGFSARSELKALRGYRARIDGARARGGALDTGLIDHDRREILLDFERRWYGEAIKLCGPRPGLCDLLSFFVARGIPQVVVSDYQPDYKLDALGLRDRFAAIYVGESLGFVKPSPKLFERVAADFKIPMASILHIGDRVDRDAPAARAAGCQCLILGRDFQSFSEVLAKLRAVI